MPGILAITKIQQDKILINIIYWYIMNVMNQLSEL